MAEKQTDVMTAREKEQERQQGQQHSSRPQSRDRLESRSMRSGQGLMSPFALLQRLADGVTGVFDDFASSRGGLRSGTWGAGLGAWSPDVDVFQRSNELVMRVDLPGLKPDDVAVEVSDNAITISGERQHEREDERAGVYRFERTYGSFYRVIPLPEGALGDQAKANFHNGVLEITVPSPPEQVARGRRLEISQGPQSKSDKKS